MQKPTPKIRELKDTPKIQPNRLAFVAGLHRSGTSILHRQLREHPDVSGFNSTGAPEDEGQHLQTVFPTAEPYGGPGRFGFHTAARMTEGHAAALEPHARDLLLRQWGAHWDLSRPVLIEKSPPTVIRSRFLQQLFPGCRFVFIVRHPIPVAYATRKWSKTTIAELVCHWALVHAVLLDDIHKLEQALVVRYEDYIAAPDRILRHVQNFLQLRPHAAGEPVADRNASYLEEWRRELAAADALDALLGTNDGIMGRFGYGLRQPFVRAMPAIAGVDPGQGTDSVKADSPTTA